ncbi:sugar porter family MFS transporter [Schleiferiaceae bacterium]|nr:sugar porter family MFS transporter [Schleiferiaceae bacterium]MDA8582277.1 sugar porter family MFS transporter [Schleiferiaceae bacterium]MDB2627741.1 sugar porter family MFS transporter [Schleiferiaceae bacterium]
MNKTWIWSLTVALAGFLFGFDTVVISGANAPIKELWQTSAWFHGVFIMSMALWGTVLGSLAGGIPTKRIGRKNTLIWVGVLYLVSALGSGLASDPYMFSFFRFLGGVGVGASTVAAPTYISEISTAKNRGRLVAMYQFNIVFGILIAFISNFLLDGFNGTNDWRWMLGIEAIPAALYCLLIFGVPNSPRWLAVTKGNDAQALQTLELLLNDSNAAKKELAEIKRHTNTTSVQDNVFNGKFKKPLQLAFLLAFFNQLSGINFILYYAPVILENAGFASSDSLLSSISIGGTNLLFTFIGLYLIDKMGRKSLMYIGSIGYILSLLMVAYGFKTGATAEFNLFFILTFIASHAVGQGAVIWVFISEIFPNSVRAAGQAWGTGTHWVFAALITMLGEVVIDAFPGWTIFAFFAAFMLLQLLFTHFMMPETKGVSLEELQDRLSSEDA